MVDAAVSSRIAMKNMGERFYQSFTLNHVWVEMGSRMGGKEKKEGQVEMIFPLLRLNLYDGWTARHIKYQTKYWI